MKTATETNEATPTTANPLSGMTILRFAHAYDTGGGVELHLRDLNRGLGNRNPSLTTILVHLARYGESLEETTETVGQATLIKAPLPTHGDSGPNTSHAFVDDRTALRRVLPKLLDLALFSPQLNRLIAGRLLAKRRVPRRMGEALHAGPKIDELLHKHKIDLVVLHTNGGSDATEVIKAARAADVPVALIHHFSNDKLGNLSARQQAAWVDSLGGASAIALPYYARPGFTNLSDAVDLEFFQQGNAAPPPRSFDTPILFAPGRITRDKGQMDALEVAIALKRRGIKATLVYAGRVDDPAFEVELQKRVQQEGLDDSVHFAGELTLPVYRDWFSAASVMLMPTHHHEGMPRTLVDSQAMRVPPIVYDIGGTREGVRHGETGFLVRFGDVAAMTECAAELLTNDNLRHRMAASGRQFVENHFSMDAFLARHEQFYLKTIALHQPGRKNSVRGKTVNFISSLGFSGLPFFPPPEFTEVVPLLHGIIG